MTNQLAVSVGQYSDKGRKLENQDFHGVLIPKEPQLSTKGVVAAIADGISSSQVSHIASESSVRSLLDDYYCTSETWSVKKSAMQVLRANNSWLHSQTDKSEHKYNKDKGYVCTLSALIIKSNTAYIFHLGDSRIYHFRAGTSRQLTTDHRRWVSQDKSYLSRAMGIFPQLDLDYDSCLLETGDIFVLVTDGVYEYLAQEKMLTIIDKNINNLDAAAKEMADYALAQGSEDNLSAQIIVIKNLPSIEASERMKQLTQLAFPPVLNVRDECDGFKILRILYASNRSHVYLAKNLYINNGEPVVIKAPSIELKEDPSHLERFLMEEWIAKRISSAHVLKPLHVDRERKFLFTTFEFIEGQTLTQWMIDNPKPCMQKVRAIIEQIAKGMQAFHRLEILHQDLRPENIMIDNAGVVKIIDFGSAKVAGLMEMTQPITHQNILGTMQYTAPEYFLGEAGTSRSDLFSLAVITYQMLTGKLPYGTHVANTRTKSAQNKLTYQTALHDDRDIPAWVDFSLKKALEPDPYKRYQQTSEFIYDLRQPNKTFLSKTKPPLIERDPVIFWQSISCLLVVIIIILLTN